MTVNMTNPYWWEAHDDLQDELGREPTYEEVLDELNRRFGWRKEMTPQEKKEIAGEVVNQAFKKILSWFLGCAIMLIVFELVLAPILTYVFKSIYNGEPQGFAFGGILIAIAGTFLVFFLDKLIRFVAKMFK